MAGTGSEQGLTLAEIEAVLASQGFGSERPRSGAVILALLDPLRIVWANTAATSLFETNDAEELQAQVFSGRGREGLGASIDRLVPDGAPRLERLRLIRGFRSHTLIVQASRTALPDGRPVAVLAMAAPDGARMSPEHFTASGLDVPDHDAPQTGADEEQVTPPADAEPATPLAAEPEQEVTLLDQPQSAEELAQSALQPLRERFSAARPTRLLWQTDATHRLLKRSGGLPELAGPEDGEFGGRPLDEVLGSDDAGDKLTWALVSAAPWSGLHLRWPLAGIPATVAVTLGAVPVFDRMGQFEGFRGFGIVDPTDVKPSADLAGAASDKNSETAPPVVPGPLAAADPAEAPVTPVAEEVQPALVPSHSEGEGEVPAAAPGRQQDREIPVHSPKVVSLRPYQTFVASPALIPSGAKTEAPAAPPLAGPEPEPTERPAAPVQGRRLSDRNDLTSNEKLNFDEIGRALLRTSQPGRAEAAGEGEPSPAEANASGLLAALGVSVLVVSNSRFLYANPAFFEVTGYASLGAIEAAGGLAHLLGGLDPDSALGEAEDRAFPLIGAGGAVVAMEGRLRAVTWDNAPARLLTMRRATDRIAQAQMLEGEIKRRDLDLIELRGMLDRISDSIVTVDRQGRVLTLNAAAERLFELSVTEAAGEPLAMLVGPDAQVAVNAGDSAAELGRTGLDVTGRAAGGKALPLRMTWNSLSHGRSCVILRDQQERSSLQRDLASTQERLDQALAGRPEFLAKISHEIRTPMSAILGFAEVMLEERFGPVGNERYRSYLRDIHDSGAQVLGLVNDLLDLSRMDAAPMEMHPAPLDVNRVVGECVGEMQAVANRERVIMRLSLLPHLAAAMIDEQAFRQIIGHILSNAIRFNEPGGQVIVSTAMNEAGAVAVRVRDTGIGMTESEVAAAMEPFRISRTVQPGGNGLGLPLARALVEASGATMSIRSQKNEGTLVEILLPSSPAARMRVPAA